MRQVKFRAWFKNEYINGGGYMHYFRLGQDYFKYSAVDIETGFSADWTCEISDAEAVMQYTGLKDKNGGQSTCIYEGDFVSLSGIVIGNKYENEELGQDSSNLPIEGFGTRTWRITEEKAMGRGCSYS